jgi:hypothetical protein
MEKQKLKKVKITRVLLYLVFNVWPKKEKDDKKDD